MKVEGRVLHPKASAQLDAFLNAPAHAVMLSGPVGGGKIRIARELAAQLLGAQEAALENHAYYRQVLPSGTAISIEQVRELIKFFRLKVPGSGSIKRVALLCDADSMGHEAQNALLKLLEEPPIDSVLIVTTSLPNRLLATVLSRMQTITLPAPDAEALRTHFAHAGYSDQAVSGALLRAGTNIAEAERLLQAGAGTPDGNLDLVKRCLSGTTYDRMLLVDGLAKQKDAAKEFVDTLTTVAMASLDATARKNIPVRRWQDILQAAHTAQGALEHSGNVKLVLTELMLAL